ncbi:hypothetical protein [Longispora fulva]|uniref:Putative RNA methylase n=1 Tax=Longispora fulva TaxID=619741 RepID=A0A8J7G6L3_9ACTN|nr:hypothetical protein [Longispora fulva]MBG6134643.1 putative RNA methylase [Longispora fulva]
MHPELTPARRAELAALLDDDSRLRAEYPKVADYLDMAPGLSGTGDAEADGSFDLRLVHHMTAPQEGNPLWSIVGPSVTSVDGRRVINNGSANGSTRLAYAQMTLQAAYAYAVPSPETIQWVSDFAEGRRIIDLGAGRGYWARQLAEVGVEVSAHDIQPPNSAGNASFPRAAGQRDAWFEVRDTCHVDLQSDAVLLLCWPPGWGDRMASTALQDFEKAGGRRVVYIGEPRGGKTGDDLFHDALAERWELASTDQDFVSWWNLHDLAAGYTLREE